LKHNKIRGAWPVTVQMCRGGTRQPGSVGEFHWEVPGPRHLLSFFIQIAEPLLDQRLVQTACFQVSVGIGVGETAVFGAVVHDESGAMRVEHPFDALI
jgi:GTP cyclohydrolase III